MNDGERAEAPKSACCGARVYTAYDYPGGVKYPMCSQCESPFGVR